MFIVMIMVMIDLTGEKTAASSGILVTGATVTHSGGRSSTSSTWSWWGWQWWQWSCVHLDKNGGLGCVHFSLTRSIPSLDYDLGWCWGWSLAWSQASTSLEPDRIDSPGRDSSLQSQEALWAWALPSPPPSRPRTWPGCLRPAPPAGTPPKPTHSFYI